MKKVIELADGFFAEIEDDGYTELGAKDWSGDVLKEIGENFDKLTEKFYGFSERIRSNDCLESVQVECSVKLGTKGGFLFVQGSSEAHFLVRLSFKAGNGDK